MIAIRILVTGRVQGVLFRATAKKTADALGITGWVRNTDDGNVEIHAEGSPESMEQFQLWCHKGPPAAQVENVTLEDAPEEQFTSFEIRR
ncbi:MAG TPA: acylphosphatase [Candidatus Peribacteraceae bacterium]|nr:acylphosphatase [Candidatus Peribacteraceae bacterium]